MNYKLLLLLICFLPLVAKANDDDKQLTKYLSSKDGAEFVKELKSSSFEVNYADAVMFQQLSDLINSRYGELASNGKTHDHIIDWLKRLPSVGRDSEGDKKEREIIEKLYFLYEVEYKKNQSRKNYTKETAIFDVLNEYLSILSRIKPLAIDQANSTTVTIRATDSDEIYEMLYYDFKFKDEASFTAQERDVLLKNKLSHQCKLSVYIGNPLKGQFTLSCEYQSIQNKVEVNGYCEINNQEKYAVNLDLVLYETNTSQPKESLSYYVWCTNKSKDLTHPSSGTR